MITITYLILGKLILGGYSSIEYIMPKIIFLTLPTLKHKIANEL